MLSKLTCLSLAILLSVWASPAQALIPLPDENGQYTTDAAGNLIVNPDFSLSNLPRFNTSGSFQADQTTINLLGYDPSRTWSAGDRPVDVMLYGDLTAYGLSGMTLEQINGSLNQEIPLSELKLLEKMSLNDLVKVVPRLKTRSVKEVKPIADILPKELQNIDIARVLDDDISGLAKELRRNNIDQLKELLKEQLLDNQQLTVIGISEGIDITTEGIINDLRLENPLLTINQTAIANQAKAHIDQQLTQAEAQLRTEIDEQIKNFYKQPQEEVNTYIQQTIAKHQQQIEQIVESSKAQITQSIKSQIAEELNLTQLNIIDQKLASYKEAVTGFVTDTTTNITLELSKTVGIEFAKTEELAQKIPDELGDLTLDRLNLSSYTINDIPGIEKTPINKFKNYQNKSISSVPGIAELPAGRYPQMPTFGGGLGRIDLVFSQAEQFAERAISGSAKEGFNNTYCYANNSENGGCAHIELTGSINSGLQWVSGDSQKVRGGKGFLAMYKGGKEPTGRLPFIESPFKMVLRNNNELTDTTQLYLAMQFCVTVPFSGKACTPHNVVEIPLMDYRVGDWIYLGINL